MKIHTRLLLMLLVQSVFVVLPSGLYIVFQLPHLVTAWGITTVVALLVIDGWWYVRAMRYEHQSF